MAASEEGGSAPGVAFAFGTLTVGDLFAPTDAARLASLCTVIDAVSLQHFDDPQARAALANTEILVTGWGCPKIDAAVLASAPRLKLIAHAAGSIKGWVTPDVFARGIAVVGAADANAIPVAEFTLAAILFANKRVFDFAANYRRDRRGLDLYLKGDPAIGNFGKTIGIVGASRIGRLVIERLQPFDYTVLLYDPFVSAEEAAALGARKTGLDELLATSDVVSLHAPSLPETRHMLDARRLGLMRDGTMLINTARGALIDEPALMRELESGRLSAVLDVTDPDVPPPESSLYDLPNVLLTPHIAGALGSERHRFGRLVVEEIGRFIRGESLKHRIDPATIDRQA
ncbi:MAG: hydroxyacid dehydrogenase [Devosia sp.]